jgi:hypothetical protein
MESGGGGGVGHRRIIPEGGGCYTPEEDILHSHRRENLKSYICYPLFNFFSKSSFILNMSL